MPPCRKRRESSKKGCADLKSRRFRIDQGSPQNVDRSANCLADYSLFRGVL